MVTIRASGVLTAADMVKALKSLPLTQHQLWDLRKAQIDITGKDFHTLSGKARARVAAGRRGGRTAIIVTSKKLVKLTSVFDLYVSNMDISTRYKAFEDSCEAMLWLFEPLANRLEGSRHPTTEKDGWVKN